MSLVGDGGRGPITGGSGPPGTSVKLNDPDTQDRQHPIGISDDVTDGFIYSVVKLRPWKRELAS